MKKYVVMFGVLSLLIAFVTSSVLFVIQQPVTKQVSAPKTKTAVIVVEQQEEIVEEVEIETTSATIAGVGDVLIAISIISDVKKANDTFNFQPLFEYVKPYILEADIAFANQETIIGGKELGLSGYPLFNSPYEVADALVDTGFDIVSIANNHTLDAGEEGVLNAIKYYQSLHLPYTGAYESEKDRSVIRLIERNGIVFSFLAYSYGTNGIPVPDGKDYLINLIDVDKVNDEITRAKVVSDVVVLSLHFGNEYELLPNPFQKDLVYQFAETGADIILGHHPHVLQPMEWIEREDGKRTFASYSLGNFISGQVGIEREIGGIVKLEVVKTTINDDVSIELKDPRFLPTYTYKQNWRNYKIYPLHEIDNDRILPKATEHLEEIKGHVSMWMPELTFEW